jgi:uncharacterized protein (TIGR03085 family)
MTTLAQEERNELCDLMLQTGPDAPTLCHGWTTRDLAAHLVVRERRPDAAAGIVIKRVAAYGEKVRLEAADQPWEQLVETVRSGPPKWSPQRLQSVDKFTNSVEYFVHHEDVRRAADGWEPRALAPDTESALWAMLRRGSRMMVRKVPMGLVLATPDGQQAVVRKAKAGQPTATITAPVGELVMFLSGRQDHARVQIDPPGLTDQLLGADLGL